MIFLDNQNTSSTTIISSSSNSKVPESNISPTLIVSPIIKLNNLNQAGSSEEDGVYKENFSKEYTVKEVGKLNDSKNKDWWVGSGGYFYSKSGLGSTQIGPISYLNFFRLEYVKSNPTDTDNGYFPQNIFRLVNISRKWQDLEAEVYFKVDNDNLTDSSNRNASNGLLLMTRYKDSNNLYYGGYRVDGTYIVKKKKDGEYYTLAQKNIFTSGIDYDRNLNPNLLPHKTWLGLKLKVENVDKSMVLITLYSDIENKGSWEKVISVEDDGKRYGGDALIDSGYVGIRTDFMDVYFDNLTILELN